MSSRREMALLVGDNPFHGISHLSQERARVRGDVTSQPEYAADLVMISLENGANGFMFSVSEMTLSILQIIRETGRDKRPRLYAIMPYAFEYVRLSTQIGTIGLAKKFEEIYIPEEKEPIVLPEDSLTLKLFQRVRDEAHRFAVRLHKKQREKRTVGSILDNIKGIGPATRNKLLKHFGSVENIKIASKEELSKIVGKELAENIKNKFNK